MTDRKINILGAGLMGRQICALMSLLGWEVSLWSRTFDDAKRKRLEIEKKLLLRSLSLPSDNKQVAGKIIFYDKISDLHPQLTIEALNEDLIVKKRLIESLAFSPSEVACLTNSSSISPSSIDSKIGAMHFFNPIAKMRIVEYFDPAPNQNKNYLLLKEDLLNAGFELCKVNDNVGLLGNHVLFSLISEVLFLVEKEDYSIESFSMVLRHLAINVDPFEIIDIVGVDVTLAIISNLNKSNGRTYIPACLQNALNAGIVGRKNKTSFKTFLTGN